MPDWDGTPRQQLLSSHHPHKCPGRCWGPCKAVFSWSVFSQGSEVTPGSRPQPASPSRSRWSEHWVVPRVASYLRRHRENIPDTGRNCVRKTSRSLYAFETEFFHRFEWIQPDWKLRVPIARSERGTSGTSRFPVRARQISYRGESLLTFIVSLQNLIFD